MTKIFYAVMLLAFLLIGMLIDRVITLDNDVEIVSNCDYTSEDVQQAFLLSMNASKEQFKDQAKEYLEDCNTRINSAYDLGLDNGWTNCEVYYNQK